MELDVEEILSIFEDELSRCGAGSLTLIQRLILERFLKHEATGDRLPGWDAIADKMDLSSGHIRDSASGLYALVRAVVGEDSRIKKSNCGRIVKTVCQRLYSVKTSTLLGREQELHTLLQAITKERRRLICVSGPPRIGKTYLVRRLWDALRSQGRFLPLVQCYAAESPTVADLYQSVLTQLEASGQPSSTPQTALIQLLSHHEYLLVIENLEALLNPQHLDGSLQEGSRCYEQWLRSLLERPNLRSCVIVVCRHPPSCLRVSSDMFLELQLSGLNDAAAEALLLQQLQDVESHDLRRLARFCGHNPGTLVAAAYKLHHQIRGGLQAFLHYPLNHRHSDDNVWREAILALSPDERQALGWLLLHPDICLEQKATTIVVDGVESRPLTNALQALHRRGLVAWAEEDSYFLAMEWLHHIVAWQLRQTLALALEARDLNPLKNHPLLVPRAPLWRRRWLVHHVLEPIDQEWQAINREAWREPYRRQVINALLDQVRRDRPLQKSFAVGNLVNIAVALKVRPQTLAMGGLTVRHADFSPVEPQQIHLSDCTLQDSFLPLPMYGALAAALSPDGRTFAVGDATGRVLCWRRQGDSYHPYRFHRFCSQDGHGLPVLNLAFGNDAILAIAAGPNIYHWWFETQEIGPSYLMTATHAVTSLAACHHDYVAVGMDDGGIMIWDNLLDRVVHLRRHHNPISELVANPRQNSWQLASKGIGDRLLIWRDIRQADAIAEELQREGDAFICTTWRNDDPVLAMLHRTRPVLWWYDGEQQALPFWSDINRFRFSHNGCWVAALRTEVIDIRNLENLSQSTTIPHHDSFNDMMLSNDGRWLLTKHYDNPHRLRVWDIEQAQVCWELTASSVAEMDRLPQLQNCRGSSAVESMFWQSYGIDC